FHFDAGNENVLELRGSFRDMHCHECGKQSDSASDLAGQSTCECGGTIRPGIVLFRVSLPQKTFKLAEQLTKQADLFNMLGSSLSVIPANMFRVFANVNGSSLFI